MRIYLFPGTISLFLPRCLQKSFAVKMSGVVCIRLMVKESYFTGKLINVALNKTVTGSSDAGFHRIVDGNTNQYFTDGSCSLAYFGVRPYMNIDLGDLYLIEYILVYKRMDNCCSK